MAHPLLISFPESTIAEANKLAGSLALIAQASDRDVSVEKLRENPDSLDGGTSLAIILGSAAVGSPAKGISSWIARHAGTTIRIHSSDGAWVDIKNATGQDTAQIVQAALAKR